MGCQFAVFSIFCTLVNMFAMYYAVVFCNIFAKSSTALLQGIIFTLVIDLFIAEITLFMVQACIRQMYMRTPMR